MKLNRIMIMAGLGLIVTLLSACGDKQSQAQNSSAKEQQTFEWKLVTTWPKNFPGLGHAPEEFAQKVRKMSNGRLKIKVYGAGELVPALEVFDAVSQGTAEMGHAAAYYWKGKMPAAQIFGAIPFGMNAQEVNGWLRYGGGLKLWRDLYKPFGVIPFPGGNTGVQMAGWFKKPITSLEDFQGVKMRIPGLGGEVLKKVGGIPVSLSGGEIFTSLQSGAIDATEWVGPYNDLAFGLYKAADYYYYSGWHEPGSVLEFEVNQKAYESLPADLQEIVATAAQAVNADMLDEYTARNNMAMQTLIDKHQVNLLPLPADVIVALKNATVEVMKEQSEADPQFDNIYRAYVAFQKGVSAYHHISEVTYYRNRDDVH
ncbi:TRAP transporter substrate-binding protein [Neptunicella marina]|uniref:TRAP transporter substrate-binding protein n=1 Tax=Neptunicella marina TaxID=2125989 RepID=A0A8J6ISD3_9ALTE|nr:TRAP transporter substrate-binding protein [Neptunicella marina]MBC3765404.1 TRAP transporter substrate-binding protein [Neptunicella marina]